MMGFQLLFASTSLAGKGAECSLAAGAFGLKWSGNVVRRVGCVCVSWKEGESIYQAFLTHTYPTPALDSLFHVLYQMYK